MHKPYYSEHLCNSFMYLTSNLQNKNDISITLPEISFIASSNIVKGNHKKNSRVMPIKGLFFNISKYGKTYY